MVDHFDVAIVGGGILGLATATALRRDRPGINIVVLEAAGEVGSHQSGHNSGVLHSGLYYAPGSLRAELCVGGRRQMVEFCEANGVPYEITGKLVIATRPAEVKRLENLEARAKANGLTGVRQVKPGEWDEIEPNAQGLAALWVPEAGVTEYAEVCRVLARQLESEVRTSWAVTSIRRNGTGWELSNGDDSVRADKMLACAGLQADRVAEMAGVEPPVRIVPFRGEYHRLVGESEKLVRHLIYPVPDPRFPFLGVHFTRRVDGTVEVGPNAVPAIGRHHYRGARPDLRDFGSTLVTPGFARLAGRYLGTGISEMVRSKSKRLYGASARRLVPDMRTSDLARGGAGVRAQAVTSEGKLVDDFSIVAGEGSFHVLNAPSPAATASLAIGKHLAGLLYE